MAINRIEVTFQADVEISKEHQRELIGVLTKICGHYEAKHPGRVMWVFGVGGAMLTNPFRVDDNHPMEFDNTILSIECAEREDYKK